MEILAPVGGKEQLIAAVRSGADAVYLGTHNFNARRNAENFDEGALEECVSYCHSRNVKVYVTFNTLITDKELESAAKEIRNIALCGADAIIVQDLAAWRLIKDIVPTMPIHASTQMTVHNLSGAKMLEELGFCRVVPARELTLYELENIKKNTSLELEVFIHGALCMSISGQCYLSSVLGGRSANRGLCAQPCRLNFKSKNGDYSLSLKDLCAIDEIDKLKEIGIDSIKIEGRMKRPEYVAAATAACKKALYGENFDKETLKSVFSRSGFTNGYILNKRDTEMFGHRTKEDVKASAGVLKTIANTYRNEAQLIGVKMYFSAKANKEISLKVSDGAQTVRIHGCIPQNAITKELDEQTVKHSLEKCGGTQFYLSEIQCEIDKGLSVSASELNKLRKNALTLLSEEKSKGKPHIINPYTAKSNLYSDRINVSRSELYIFVSTPDQICNDADKIIIDYKLLYSSKELCEKYKNKLIARLPLLMFSEGKTFEILTELKSRGIEYVFAPNLYAIYIAKKAELKIMGGYPLNIINSIALNEYTTLGLSLCELSFENTLRRVEALSRNIPCGIVAYGKMPLMSFRNCPVKSHSGCGKCDGKQYIVDRYGNKMPIVCHGKQYGQLLNPIPIYIGDKKDELSCADFLTLHFTDESPKECADILNKVISASQLGKPYTRGLYYKDIK